MPDKNEKTDYDVGYKKPPQDSRFKPGQSGNPTGKRKPLGKPGFSTDLTVALSEQVAVAVGDKTVKLTAKELIVKKLIEEAANGSKKALKRLIALREHVHEKGEIESVRIDFTAEDAKVMGR